MTRITLNWKKQKPTGPVYLEEAAQLLGTTYEALRMRVHRMKNDGQADTLPDPFKDTSSGRERWAFNRADFMAFVKLKNKLDAIVKGSGK